MKKTQSNQSNTSELKLIITQIVGSIPYGKVASYGQVARLSGYPSHARFVGAVLKQLPSDSSLPWHRVVNGKGRVSFPLESESYIEQCSKLLSEGVEVHEGVISMRKFGWLA